MFTKNKVVACANLPLSMVGLLSTASVVNLKFPRVKLDKIQKRYQIYSSRIKTKETRSNPQKISDGSQNDQKNLEILNLYSREFLSQIPQKQQNAKWKESKK